MRLRYKITFVLTAISLITIISVALFYANFLLQQREQYAKDKLLSDSEDLAFHLEQGLLDKLDAIKVMQSPYIVCDTLKKSNTYYESMPKKDMKQKIADLNTKWMHTGDRNDTFIKKYTDNPLARYLKRQLQMFPGVYGEIFITNRHGALVASTEKLTTFEHDFKYWWKESYDYGYGKVFFDDRGFDESVGGYVLGIVVPIKRDGVIVGIMKANVSVHSLLKKVLREYNSKKFAKAKIVRTKGEVVYEEHLPPLSTRVPPDVSKRLKTLKEGVADIKIFNQKDIVAYSPVRVSLDNENIIFGGKKNSIDHLLGNDGEIWHVVISVDKNRIYNYVLRDLAKVINVAMAFILFLSIVIFIVMDRIGRPLVRLRDTALRIAKGERDMEIRAEGADEIGDLANSFKYMLQNLKETTASRDELEKEIKKNIEAQIALRKKDELLIAQSKQAAMGEMISMIAHQWRQPISVISMTVNNIMIDLELDDLSEDAVRECSAEILTETQYLSQTIDDFRNFFKPDKEKRITSIEELCDDVRKLMGKALENNNIKFSFKGDTSLKIKTYDKELLQVFINLLNNAKDALVDAKVENKSISVSAYKKDGDMVFEFCDNANGVKEEIIDRIFEPYFSTKMEKNGTGLGLYMSKTIVEKHLLGSISVQNRDDGACFIVEIPVGLEDNDG